MTHSDHSDASQTSQNDNSSTSINPESSRDEKQLNHHTNQEPHTSHEIEMDSLDLMPREESSNNNSSNLYHHVNSPEEEHNLTTETTVYSPPSAVVLQNPPTTSPPGDNHSETEFSPHKDQYASPNPVMHVSSVRDFIWNTLEMDIEPTLLGKLFNVFDVTIIGLSVLFFVLGTEPLITSTAVLWIFFVFEYCIAVFFTVEWLLRLWSCRSSPRYRRRGFFGARLRFIFSFSSIVDLLSIVPSLVSLNYILGVCISSPTCMDGLNDSFDFTRSSTFLRVFRLLQFSRLFRLGRMDRYVRFSDIFKGVVVSKYPEIITALALVLICVVTLSAAIHWTERDENPEFFGSIPRSLYWTIISLSTLGYGDVVPSTVLGKIIACFTAIAAVSLIASSTSILGSSMMEMIERQKKTEELITLLSPRATPKRGENESNESSDDDPFDSVEDDSFANQKTAHGTRKQRLQQEVVPRPRSKSFGSLSSHVGQQTNFPQLVGSLCKEMRLLRRDVATLRREIRSMTAAQNHSVDHQDSEVLPK